MPKTDVVFSEGLISSARTVQRIISGPDKTGKKISRLVQAAEVEGKTIFEGDILLVTRPAPELFRAVAIDGAQFRWKGGLIPFRIDPALPRPERVRQAVAHWVAAKTGIQFQEITATNRAQFKDFVTFVDQGACFSAVGRQGGEQVISLGPACTKGNAIHEIGHTVGLWHEQSREDRAKFVEIHLENVMSGMAHNFEQHILDGTDLGDYDYGSVMHYPRNAFSKNGKDTIVARGGQAIGQRDGLSERDIAGVKLLYPDL